MHKESAFTLIELLVTVAVLAVLLAIAVPAFADVVRDSRLISLNNDLNLALQRARSEAIKHRRQVVVCKSAGSGCTDTGGWQQGWIVFHDFNRDHQCLDPDADLVCEDGGLMVLIQQPVSSSGITINGGSGNTDKRVSFEPSGFATGYAGTFSFCDGRGVQAARGLVVSLVGRIRQAKATDNIQCPS